MVKMMPEINGCFFMIPPTAISNILFYFLCGAVSKEYSTEPQESYRPTEYSLDCFRLFPLWILWFWPFTWPHH